MLKYYCEFRTWAGLACRLHVHVENSGMTIRKEIKELSRELNTLVLSYNKLHIHLHGNSLSFQRWMYAELEDSHIDIFGKTIQSPVSLTYLNTNCNNYCPILFFLLGDSSEFELYVTTFRNTLFHFHRSNQQEEIKNYCPAIW